MYIEDSMTTEHGKNVGMSIVLPTSGTSNCKNCSTNINKNNYLKDKKLRLTYIAIALPESA